MYAKGSKIRDITIPTSYLDFLRRYRVHQNLSLCRPAVKILRLFTRCEVQVARLVQEIFDKAYERKLTGLGIPARAWKLREDVI